MALDHDVTVNQLAGTDEHEVSCETCEERGVPYTYQATSETFANSVKERHILKWKALDKE